MICDLCLLYRCSTCTLPLHIRLISSYPKCEAVLCQCMFINHTAIFNQGQLLQRYIVCLIKWLWPRSLSPMHRWPVDERGPPGHFTHKVLEEDILEVALRCSRHLAHHTAVIGPLYLGPATHTKKRQTTQQSLYTADASACNQFESGYFLPVVNLICILSISIHLHSGSYCVCAPKSTC